MEEDKQKYLDLMTEIISKEMIVLGPEIAVMVAQGVGGLEVDEKGKAVNISGFSADAVKNLVDEYIRLSGRTANSFIDSLFDKYPGIKKNNK